MENRFNNRDFEQFVKQNADQYRMFPSEKVWNNIHNTLHVRRRWYGFGIALLLISVTAVTLVMVNQPEKNKNISQSAPPQHLLNKIKEEANKPAEVFIAPAKAAAKKNTLAATNTEKEQAIVFLSDFNDQTVADDYTESSAPLADNSPELIAPVIVRKPDVMPAIAQVRSKALATTNNKSPENKLVPAAPAKALFTTIADNSIAETAVEPKEQKAIVARDANLLTIESVVNSYKHNVKGKRLALQLFITPTVSYRDLKENKAFLRGVQAGTTTPLANVYIPDINSIVTHKPDLGFQLGLTAGYPLSKKITLTAGLQFTVSKYDIKAYSAPREEATITLSNSYGGSSSVSTYTNYRNIGGFKANWLHNLYLSASVPVGLEVKLVGNRKGYVGVGANIQPTYVLDNRSYLLSTDYKNYAEMPSLIRKWNINTGFEIFVANNSGKINWRVGPQVRYQTLSSFKNKYPVEEHLFDFGLKLGVMLR